MGTYMGGQAGCRARDLGEGGPDGQDTSPKQPAEATPSVQVHHRACFGSVTRSSHIIWQGVSPPYELPSDARWALMGISACSRGGWQREPLGRTSFGTPAAARESSGMFGVGEFWT